MRIIKTDDEDLIQYSKQLKTGREQESNGGKASTAAKAAVVSWLEANRQIKVSELPMGEVVMIQVKGRDTLKLEIKPRQQFELVKFRAQEPSLAKRFTAELPAMYVDPLI